MQQLAQRVMQYGWDFAGLWFEMWTRMGGNATGWPPPASGPASIQPEVPARSPGHRESADPAGPGPARLSVCVVSERPTVATLEVRPGVGGPLVVHTLRAEGHDAPAIRDVTIESSAGDDAVTVKVVVPASQPPGVYNGLIIDGASNLPRGTVSVRVCGDE
jgi:hypothetical protein